MQENQVAELVVAITTFGLATTNELVGRLIPQGNRQKDISPQNLRRIDALTLGLSAVPIGDYFLEITAQGAKPHRRRIQIEPHRKNYEAVILGDRSCSYYKVAGREVPFAEKDLFAWRKVNVSEKKVSAKKLVEQDYRTIELPERLAASGAMVASFEDGNKAAKSDRSSQLKTLSKLADVRDVGMVLEHEGERLVWLSNMILIETASLLDPKRLKELQKLFGLRSIDRLENAGLFYLAVYDGIADMSILAVANAIEQEEDVLDAEVSIHTAGELLTPNDYLYPMQWHLTRMHVEEAWDTLAAHSAALEYGSPAIQVAIHDTGIQSVTEGGISRPSNPDFSDDLPGAISKVGLFYSFSAQEHHNDGAGSTHGAMVAGLVGANVNKLHGSVGIAPHTRLMGLVYNSSQPVMAAVFNWISGLNPGFATVFPTTTAINLPQLFEPAGAGGPGPDIINSSFKLASGVTHPALTLPFRKALSNAGLYGRRGRGVCIFWPSGNFSLPTNYPPAVPMGAEPQVMAVGGSTLDALGNLEIHAPQAGFGNAAGGYDRLEFCAPTDNRFTPLNNVGTIAYDPPTKWGLITTSTFLHGPNDSDANVPDRIASSLATVTTAVAPGDNFVVVTTVAGFAIGQDLVIGDYGVAGYEIIKSDNQFGENPAHNKIVLPSGVTFASPHLIGSNVQGLGFANAVASPILAFPTTITLNNATGFLAGQWIVIGVPGDALSEAKEIDSVAGNVLTFATALANEYPAGPVPVQMLGGVLDTTLSTAATAGNTTITIPSVYGFTKGHAVIIGLPDGNLTTEMRTITNVSAGNQLTLNSPLDKAHPIGTPVRGGWPMNTNNGGGTSAASPEAAGVAALVLAVNPQLSFVEVRDILRRSADKIEIDRSFSGKWSDTAGNSIVNGSGNLILVSPAISTTISGNPVAAAVTISVASVVGFVAGQAIQVGSGGTKEICIIYKVNVGTLDITALQFPHSNGDDVKGGRIPYYSTYLGFGRVNAKRAVDFAIAYAHSHRDLILRDYFDSIAVQDDGLTATNVALHPIHSPDIFLRNQPDTVAALGLNYQADGPHQAPSNGITSVTYTNNVSGQNDLIGKGFFNSTTDRTFKIEIRSVAPETFRWKRNGVGWTTQNVVAGDIALSEGIVIRFGAITGHQVGDKWEIEASGEDFYVYTRVRNIGNGGPGLVPLSSLDCWVRSFVAISDGATPPAPYVGGPVIQTPFLFPRDWTTADGISTIGTNTGTNKTYYVNETLISEGTIAANADETVRITWNRNNLPPITNVLPTWLLAYAAPVDGALEGFGAEDANNLSYREFAFTTLETRATGGIDKLPNLIETPDGGAVVSTPFVSHFRRYFGNMVEGQMEIYIVRSPLTGPDETARYFYDGTTWKLDDGSGGVPTWATITMPVIGGTATPATGAQTDVSFTGSFDVNETFNFLQIRLRVYSALHPQNVLSEALLKISVGKVALPTGYAPTPPPLYPRSFGFAEMANLSQAGGKGFGPVSADVYRVTSSFTAASNTSAFAAVDGTIFIQEGANASLVNLVLKPSTQGINGFTPVKYFIYRGLLRTDFIDSGNAALVTPLNVSTNSDWVTWLYGVHNNLNGAVPFESKALGFDPSNQAPGSLLEKYFFNPDPNLQLPPAKKGIQLGTFSTVANEAGIDVLLEEGFFQPDLSYVRASHYEIDVTSVSNPFEKKAKRDQILNFLDPAAYYGLHIRPHGYVQHSVAGSVTKALPADIYADILAPFLSKNSLYVDLRDENGSSYNFSGHHPTGGTGNNIEVGEVSGSLTGQTYQTNSWPILIKNNAATPLVTPEDYNEFYIKIRPDHITKPILYIEHGDVNDTSLLQREDFIEGDSLFLSGNSHTEEIGFKHPNILKPGGGPDDKLNVSWVIKAHLGLQEDTPVTWTGIPAALPTENMYDNRFGPLDPGEIWETGLDKVRWIASQARKYIDGNLRGFGYVADRGLVFEGDVDANPNPGRILFFANAVNAFMSSEEVARSKGMHGGFSKFPSFFQELLVMKKLNLEFGLITDGGTDVTSLNLASVDTTSPHPESLLFVGLDKPEYQTLKGLMPSLSPDYPTTLKLVNVATNVDFKKYKVGLQGFDTSGNAQQVFPTTDIHVFSTDDYMCYSGAFSNLEPPPLTYTRTFEEGQGVLTKRKLVNEKILSISGTNTLELSGDWVDKIAPEENTIMIEGSTLGNNGGPYQVVSRTYDVSIKRSFIKISATLVNSLVPDGRMRLPERNLEDHFIDFDISGTLSGIPKMITLISAFQAAITAIPDDATSVGLLEAAIDDQPAKALERARIMASQGNYSNADDRILYWTRIKMAVILKSHPVLLKRVKAKNDLVARFEAKTRGFDTIDFTGAPVGTKKVLICGFDLYGVPGSPLRNNPSGSVALALHGQVLQDALSTDIVYIQSILFPNRYADFDGKNGIGVVETAFKKCIDPSDPNHTAALLPDMVITVSQALAGDFWIDRFASRNRSGYADNNKVTNKPFPALPSGQEFYETKLDPVKFKRVLNTGFPSGDLNVRTTIAKTEFSLFYNNVFNYRHKVTGVVSYYNEPSFTEVAKTGQGFDSLPDGLPPKKIEDPVVDPNLVGLVPIDANLNANVKSEYGSGGHFFSNESHYRTARMRADYNPLLPTGHLHIPLLVSTSGGNERGYPIPAHLDLDTQKNLIERTIEIIVDGNRP